MKRLCFILAIFTALAVQAQDSDTLRHEVVIIKDYVPTVREAEKINTMPPISTPSFTRSAVKYNYNALSAPVPTFATNVNLPYSRLDEELGRQYKGYADLSMGAYMTMAANAGYQILHTKNNLLNVGLQFTSLNWDIPVNSTAAKTIEEATRQTYYDARVGLNYAHIFNNDITASVQGAYRFLSFNYYGVAGNAPFFYPSHPFQQANNFYIEATVDNKEAQDYDYEHWSATAGYSLYTNHNGAYIPHASNEHHAYADVNYDYMLNSHWRIGGSIDIDYLQYNGVIGASAHADNITYDIIPNTQSLFMMRLLPHIAWDKDKMHFDAGVKIDISAHDGTVARFAPDINFKWEFIDNYFVYAAINGGKKLHTWNDVSQYCIYFDPSKRIPSTYTPLDANLGFHLHFIPEFTLSAFGGYEYSVDALFQRVGYSSQALTWQKIDASCIKAGVRVDANIGEYVTIGADATYRLWKHDGHVISYNRPRWEGNARIIVHPIEKLDIEVGYNAQLNRDYGVYGKLNDIHNLNASATYRLFDWISIFAQGNNLLNRHHDYYYGMPAPRIQGMLGVGLKF